MESNFSDLFAVNIPAWQLLLHRTVMYWVLFLMLRFVMRREVGGIGIADILVLILLADGASFVRRAISYRTREQHRLS